MILSRNCIRCGEKFEYDPAFGLEKYCKDCYYAVGMGDFPDPNPNFDESYQGEASKPPVHTFAVIKWNLPAFGGGRKSTAKCLNHFENKGEAIKYMANQQYRAGPLVLAGLVHFELIDVGEKCGNCGRTFN